MNYKDILLWLIKEEDIYIIDTRTEDTPKLYSLMDVVRAMKDQS